jgi:hypothetical protein
MKRFPEKTVMAVIILSCGFLAQSEPSAGTRKAKPASATRPQQSQVRPAATATVTGSHKPTDQYAKVVMP